MNKIIKLIVQALCDHHYEHDGSCYTCKHCDADFNSIHQCRITKLLTVLVAVMAVASCNTLPTTQYITNRPDLASVPAKSIRLGEFTSRVDDKGTISCRMADVTTPGGIPLTQYIKDAVQAELIASGRYSETGQTELKGYLDNIDSNTIGNGYWKLGFTLASNNGSHASVYIRHDVETTLNGLESCKILARELMPAVQDLMKELLTDKQMKQLVK